MISMRVGIRERVCGRTRAAHFSLVTLDQGVYDFNKLEKPLPEVKLVSIICLILCHSLSGDPSASSVHVHPEARKNYPGGQSLAFSD